MGGLSDYDGSTAAGGGAYGESRAHGGAGLAGAVLGGGAAGVSGVPGPGAGIAGWGVGWKGEATKGSRNGALPACSAARRVQHLAVNHCWLAAMVDEGFGLLHTARRPSGFVPPPGHASPRLLICPYLPLSLAALQDAPGPSPVPMPRSLIYALSCDYFRRPLLEPQVGGTGGRACVLATWCMCIGFFMRLLLGTWSVGRGGWLSVGRPVPASTSRLLRAALAACGTP